MPHSSFPEIHLTPEEGMALRRITHIFGDKIIAMLTNPELECEFLQDPYLSLLQKVRGAEEEFKKEFFSKFK